MAQKVVITGGTGLIGKRLTTLLLKKGYEVAYLSRRKIDIPFVKVFEWDVKNKYIEAGALKNTSYLIHLAGAGVADEKWTEDRKKQIFSSRTDSIELICQKLKQADIRPRSFISASGSSYYGEDTGDIQHTEMSPPGKDFLSEVTIEWEKAADSIKSLDVRTVKLRTGIVLSNDGGAVPKMALPAKFGFGAPLGTGKQWLSWIHIDDLCRLYIECMEKDSWEGAYNAVAFPPATNEDFTKQICKALNKPQWLPNVPSFALRLAFGEMANVVLGSNYVINQRIKDETDFKYEFPDLLEALKDVLSK
ncbi:TIGR01777 family oxidoreductase [Dyadobacter sp. CY356]|uniref:TIGR01777 family oxidoreductase n=1 Tax=Dyadobacter sp. CY356 TaxID=2906442 RepID=UPI001F421EC5|nr:TIGR01777 family oxidoreductase [Dyadobacter sp. CY356]MCF0056647.1 TIGR01777 family oxidoreductase [Dyadobacter sp. CY356]